MESSSVSMSSYSSSSLNGFSDHQPAASEDDISDGGDHVEEEEDEEEKASRRKSASTSTPPPRPSPQTTTSSRSRSRSRSRSTTPDSDGSAAWHGHEDGKSVPRARNRSRRISTPSGVNTTTTTTTTTTATTSSSTNIRRESLSSSGRVSLSSSGRYSALAPQKRKSNDLTDLTINKLNYENLGFYGREKELSTLQSRLDSLTVMVSNSSSSSSNSASSSSSERALVLISGTSGVGKTRLAEALRAPTLRHGGLIARGKYDLTNTNNSNNHNNHQEPYSGIAGAFSEIVGAIAQLEGKDPERFQSIRTEIETTLGTELLHLLFEVVPSLADLVDIEGITLTSDNNSSSNNSHNNNSHHLSAKPFLAVSPNDSKNRIHFAFLRLVRIVTKHFDPGVVVMVLDDLQWADASSLDLLEVILSDRQNPKLMVVGLYRSNEVDQTHIFHHYLNRFEAKGSDLKENGVDNTTTFYLDRLEIGNLDVDAVHNIIQDLLGLDDDGGDATDSPRTLGLAQLCLRKTHGNPFFLIHFLSMLYDKELLQFNFGTLSWMWNEDEIDLSTDASENVVDLLTSKMSTFDTHLLDILKLASCLGSTFEVLMLEVVWVELSSNVLVDNHNTKDANTTTPTTTPRTNTVGGQKQEWDSCPSGAESSSAFREALQELYAEGLLVRIAGLPPRVGWVHDKVQEAAMGLISESARGDFFRRVGEILVSKLDAEELDSALFVVVNLLNGSSAAATSNDDELDPDSQESRIKLARMNLEASEKAVKVSAFDTAAKCAEAGINLLPADGWTTHYELVLKLYSIGAKAEGFLGNIETMERYCRAVLSQEKRPIEDKFDVYNTYIDSLSGISSVRAADMIFDILAQFQCRIPKNKTLVRLGVLGNVIRTKTSFLRSRDPSKLRSMTDQTRVELMQFLDKLASCLYLMKDDRTVLTVFRSLNWTLKYGKCDFSPPAFAKTGMVFTGVLNDIQRGALYGRYALELAHEAGIISSSSRTLFLVYSYLFAWTRPLRELFKPLLQGYDAGLQTGDTDSATWCIYSWILYHLFIGSSLERLAADTVVYSKQMQDLKREQVAKATTLLLQSFLNLLGRDNEDNPTCLYGQVVGKDDLERIVKEPFYHACITNFQGLLFTYLGEYVRQADMVIELGHDYLAKVFMAGPSVIVHTFLTGLASFAAARQTRKTKYSKLAEISRSKIKKWLDMGNPNVRHYVAILDAEAMALKKGKSFAAIKRYEEAICLAARSGHQQDAALASERLGEFHISVMKDIGEGSYRLREAVKYWRDWGAMAKVAILEKKYPDVLSSERLTALSVPAIGSLSVVDVLESRPPAVVELA